MAQTKEYKVTGHEKRGTWYGVLEIVGVIVTAGLITYGVFTLEDVNRFVDLLDTLAGIAASTSLTVSSHVARSNVKPPAELQRPADAVDGPGI